MRFPVSVLIIVTAMSTASAQTQSPVRHGRAVVQELCARCHAIGKSGCSPNVRAPPFRTLGRSFDLDEFAQRLESDISPSHPDDFKFGEQDARDVAAYLRSIQE